MKVVDAYLAAFKKTPLVMLINGKECTAYATQHGTGWRADSMGDLGSFSPTWNHMRNAYPALIREAKVQDAWKNGPIAYEPPAAVAEFVEKQWPLRWIFNYALACHGSLFSGKSGKLPDDEHFRQELERFLRRLGYRLVLKELTHPAQVRPGEKLELGMKWQNVGSAPCYRPYRVAYRLTGQDGQQQSLRQRHHGEQVAARLHRAFHRGVLQGARRICRPATLPRCGMRLSCPVIWPPATTPSPLPSLAKRTSNRSFGLGSRDVPTMAGTPLSKVSVAR